MKFYTDQELFADIDENGHPTKAGKGACAMSGYQMGIEQEVDYITEYAAGMKAYSKKTLDSRTKDVVYQVWESADSWIEHYLREKGSRIGSFPPLFVPLFRSERISWSNNEIVGSEEVKNGMDYFEQLDRCVSNLEYPHESEKDPSLNKYFSGIFRCRDELKDCLAGYRRVKKSIRWILIALIWVVLCVIGVFPVIPGIPSTVSEFAPGLAQMLTERFGEKLMFFIMGAIPLLQIVSCCLRGMMSFEDHPVLFWVNFPIVSIAVALIGVYGIGGMLSPLTPSDYVGIALVMLAIYVIWLLINLCVTVVIRCQEAGKKKDMPKLRAAFVKEVEQNAPKIHRYIRLRTLWWKYYNGEKNTPYCLDRLQKLLDEAVKEAEKYQATA